MAALALTSASAPAPALASTSASTPAPALASTSASASAPAPAPMWAQGGDGDGVDVGVLALLRLRDQMKEQLTEYSGAILANQENSLDPLKINIIEENLIESAIKDLQRNTEEVKVSFQNKTLALQRIQIMNALRNKLEKDDEDSRLILETIKLIGFLSRTIIAYQQKAHEKEEQLIDMKRKRLSLQVNEGQKLQQIQTMMKRQKEKQASMNVTEIQKRLHKLEQEKQITTIIQNVLQKIVFGSRVNWAEDPSLKAVVLQLEKNVCLQ